MQKNENEQQKDTPQVELVALPGEIQMTIQVTRKETGKVETYHLTGTAENGSNAL